jgi:hypothetical protein
MTKERVFLSTQQSHLIMSDSLRETFNSSNKRVCVRKSSILDFSILVACWIGRPSSKLLTQEDECDVKPCKIVFKRLAVELRITAAVGLGSNIADRGNAVCYKEIQKRR